MSAFPFAGLSLGRPTIPPGIHADLGGVTIDLAAFLALEIITVHIVGDWDSGDSDDALFSGSFAFNFTVTFPVNFRGCYSICPSLSSTTWPLVVGSISPTGGVPFTVSYPAFPDRDPSDLHAFPSIDSGFIQLYREGSTVYMRFFLGVSIYDDGGEGLSPAFYGAASLGTGDLGTCSFGGTDFTSSSTLVGGSVPALGCPVANDPSGTTTFSAISFI